MPRVICVPVGAIRTNCYIVYEDDRADCAVIDPGGQAWKIRQAAEGRHVAAILLTHGHFDHIGGVRELMEEGTELLIHEADAAMLSDPEKNASLSLIGAPVTCPPATRLLREGDRFTAAGMDFTVLHTPGHTPGGVCYRTGSLLFTGDTLMREGIGRTDLPGGSDAQMAASLRRLQGLTEPLTFLGGHG